MVVFYLPYHSAPLADEMDMVVMLHLVGSGILTEYILGEYAGLFKELDGVVYGSAADVVAIVFNGHMQRIHLEMRMQLDGFAQDSEALRRLAVFPFIEEAGECRLY